MLRCTTNTITPKFELGMKYDFDSLKQERGGKTSLDFSLGKKEDGNFMPRFSIKLSFDARKKIIYDDFKTHIGFQNFMAALPSELQNIIKEIAVNGKLGNKKKVDGSLSLKFQEKSIKAFTVDKDSILNQTSSFDNMKKRNVMCFTLEKGGDKIFAGLIANNKLKPRGLLGINKTLFSGPQRFSASLAVEQWKGKHPGILLGFSGLYNSVGINLTNSLFEIHKISQTNFSVALEPIKIVRLLFWPWIQDIIEKKYLDSFLKNVGLYLVCTREGSKISYTFVFLVKDYVQINMQKAEKTGVSIQKFEMKQTFYGG
jgi:hypothetical protein